MSHKLFAHSCLIASLAAFAPMALCANGAPAAATQEVRADAAKAPAKEIALVKLNGLLLLAAEVNGIEGFLLVDSGAMNTTLNLDVAKRMKVQLKDSNEMCIGVSGVPQRVQKADITGHVAGCGEAEFPLAGHYPFMPLPMQNGEKLDGKPMLGILGLVTLAKAGCVVDCANGRLILQSKGEYQGAPGSHRIALAKAFTNNELFAWQVPTEINGKPCMMLADTGAQITLLSHADFMKKAGVELDAKGSSFASGAGANLQRLERGVVSEMKLGGKLSLGKIPIMSCPAPTVGETTQDADGKEQPNVGILGMDQLIRMGAVLDCRQGVLYASSKPLEAMDTDTHYYDTGLVIKAVSCLAAAGDKEAKDQLAKAASNGGALSLGPAESTQFIRKAKAKGLLTPEDLKGGSGANAQVPDPGLALQAIQALAQAGDKEAKDLLAGAVANGGGLALTPDMAIKFIARAKEKGIDLKSNGAANTVCPDPNTIFQAIQTLAQAGDQEAKDMLDGAMANGGKFALTPAIANTLVARAKEKGLFNPKESKGGNTLPPPMGAVVKAVQTLAKAGDKDAQDIMSKAMANGGKLALSAERAAEFVARAKEKGLMK